jgi:toxin ParE1/3/4
MKPLVINEEAAEELEEAIEYYERKKRGLGFDLADKVSDAFQRIQLNPGFYPHHNQTRIQKYFVRRFPYTVFYAEFDDHIAIVAVAHQKRRPDYWRFRKPE